MDTVARNPGDPNSIRALGSQLRAGTTSAQALVDAILERIATMDPTIGAYVTVDADGARGAARLADGELRTGRDRGPLHGIPIGLKDVLDTAGIPTTAGSAILADRVPRRSAAVVRRLHASGAVIVGKHALTEFATGSAAQPAIGPTLNPWDLTRVPGGSSSGSAAAVAAGMAVAALGTDTSGSIRGPAALCGLVGVRPTRGLVSTAGVLPLARSFDTVGPLARSVDDAATVLGVIGTWPPDIARHLLATPDRSRVRGRTVGCLMGEPWTEVDGEVASATERAIGSLVAVGARRVDLSLTGVAGATDARRIVQYAEAAAIHATWLDSRPGDYDPSVLALLESGRRTTTVELAAARRTLTAFRRSVRGVMTAVDLLASATTPTPAWTFEAANGPARLAGIALTAPVTAMGLPALSVPSAQSVDGLPIGLQLIARPEEEPLLLAAAAVVEAFAHGPDWLPVPPPIQ